MKFRILFWCSLLAILLMTGCAHYPVNPPLEEISPSSGYRFNNLSAGEKNSNETFIIVSMSGGGTRAAALDYGVLRHLRSVRIEGGSKSLLDEVDVISTVSGSSLVGGYYGAFGEEIFFRDFREKVLDRNIEGSIARRVLAPWNWPKQWSAKYSRSDLTDAFMDKHIFYHRTYGDMVDQRPFIIINGTDMSVGAQFSFIQAQFDLLCSDLSGIKVSRAVTSSIALPAVFPAVTFDNYPNEQCGYSTPKWALEALEDEFNASSARYDRVRTLLTYEDTEERPYIHILDGGVSDNIGLRVLGLALTTRDNAWNLLDWIEDGTIKRLVVLIIDSKPRVPNKYDKKARPPGAISALQAAAGIPMANYSSDTADRVRYHLMELGESESRALDVYFIHARFDVIDDDDLRVRLETIPTSLKLPPEDIDLLIREAPALLEASEDYHRLLRDLDAWGASEESNDQ